MKSIKPGRGPSGMNFIGSIIAVVFGIFWTIIAASMMANAPFGAIGMIFPLFGVLFIIVGIVQAVYNYKNATGKDRYSIMDITDSTEEGDPADRWMRNEIPADDEKAPQKSTQAEVNYCPYCGAQLKSGYAYCPKCGKAIQQ